MPVSIDMLLQSYVSAMLAVLASVTHTTRTTGTHFIIELTDTVLDVTVKYNVSYDGTPLLVDSSLAFDHANVECPGVCIPEYHCILDDKSITKSVAALNPGTTHFLNSEVGQIICGFGLVQDKGRSAAAAIPHAVR